MYVSIYKVKKSARRPETRVAGNQNNMPPAESFSPQHESESFRSHFTLAVGAASDAVIIMNECGIWLAWFEVISRPSGISENFMGFQLSCCVALCFVSYRY